VETTLVITAALAAIAWVNWYFFLSSRTAAMTAVEENGVQTVTVVVQGGYDPALIRVRAGAPVRLVFDRQETSSCSEEIVFPDFGVKRFLPAFEKTAIELNPSHAGTFDFTCGMSMLHGKLVVEE
jgi:plastocyanin domain-containing protein